MAYIGWIFPGTVSAFLGASDSFLGTRDLWYRVHRVSATEDTLGPDNTQIRYRNKEVVWSENENNFASFYAELVETDCKFLDFVEQLALAHADAWIFGVVPYWSVGDRLAVRKYVSEEIDLRKLKVWEWRF
jgi:hypothetical protein